jgi:hypothetical protein
MEHGIERITTHRERFQTWGLLISVLSFLAAVWVTAPTLQIDIPLAGGAKASINAGYVVSLGPLFIAFSCLWAIGSLVSMRRYQESVMLGPEKLSSTQLISITGPLSKKAWNDGLYRKARSVIFFIVPTLAQLVIALNTFNHLHYYNDKNEIEKFKLFNSEKRSDSTNWGLDTTPVKLEDFFFSKYPVKGASYTLQNSDLNKECGLFMYEEYLNKKIELSADEQQLVSRIQSIGPTCVPAEFPVIELALNTWINMLMLVLTVWLAFQGSRLYAGTGLIQSQPNDLLSE